MTFDYYVNHLLDFSFMYKKRVPPWEKSIWDEKTLQNFKIDAKKVDRVYYTGEEDDMVESFLEIAGRMDYHGVPIYFDLVYSGCGEWCQNCNGRGEIFISQDVDIFMNLILKGMDPVTTDYIHRFLTEDGIQLTTEFDECESVPTLQNLCHQVVYQHKEKLMYYQEVLPKILKDNLGRFLKYKEAEEEYLLLF